MKIEIIGKKDNPLLSRQEIRGILTFDKATPSNADLEVALAKQFNVDRACVRAKRIATRYGAPKADFLVFVYNSKGDLDKVEPVPRKWLEKQQKKEESKKKSEEEAKPEEKKEESKKEGAE